MAGTIIFVRPLGNCPVSIYPLAEVEYVLLLCSCPDVPPIRENMNTALEAHMLLIMLPTYVLLYILYVLYL